MGELIGCMSVFNERASIEAAMRSLATVVDRIVVVDGAVEEHPGHGRSTDGTVEVVEVVRRSLACPVSLTVVPGLPEHEKRSVYFGAGAAGDWYFVLDGDEILSADAHEMRRAMARTRADSLTVELLTLEPGHAPGPSWRTPRLFRHYDGARYRPDHCEVWAGQRCIMSHNRPRPSTEEDCPGALITHLPFIRGEARNRLRDTYHENLAKRFVAYEGRRHG